MQWRLFSSISALQILERDTPKAYLIMLDISLVRAFVILGFVLLNCFTSDVCCFLICNGFSGIDIRDRVFAA